MSSIINRRPLTIFTTALLVIVPVYILFAVVLDFSKTWTNPEIPAYFYPRAFETGKHFQIRDLVRALDWEAFCGGARTRMLSTVLLIANAKIRQHWLQFFPPHPSLNVAWLWVFFFTPLAFFWTSQQLFKNRWHSFQATLIYLCSPGSLSGIVLNHHPGKPISNFFLTLGLGLAIRLYDLLKSGKPTARTYCLLGALLFIGPFFDESPLFLFPLVLVLLSETLLERTCRQHTAACLGIPLILLGIFFLGLAPLLARMSGYDGYPMFSYATAPNFPPFSLRISALLENIVLLSNDQLPVWEKSFGVWSILAFCILVAVFFVFYRQYRTTQEGLWLRKLAIATVCFSVLQSILMTRVQSSSMQGTFYYGSGFATVFALFLTCLIRLSSQKSLWLSQVFMVLILGSSFYHFEVQNRAWRAGHVDMYRAFFSLAEMEQKPFTRGASQQLWNERHDRRFLEQQFNKYSPVDYFNPWEVWQFSQRWDSLPVESLIQKWGSIPLDHNVFRTRRDQRKRFVASIVKAQTFRGDALAEVISNLGPGDVSCYLGEAIGYEIEKNCPQEPGWNLMFLPSNHHLKVRKVMVLSGCCM